MKKKLYLLGIMLVVCLSAFGCGKQASDTEVKDDDKWGSGELWEILPKPDSNDWELVLETETYLSLDVPGTEDEYDSYVAKCREAGFEEDLYISEGYYSAMNSDGFFVDAYCYPDEEKFSISLDDRRDGGSNTNSEPSQESTTTESTDDAKTSDEVTPEFKQAMDEYEAFFDEYVDFMNTYASSTDQMSMMADYQDYMTQYTETMEAMDAIDTSTLSDADLAYYTEVSGRISQKLLEITM